MEGFFNALVMLVLQMIFSRMLILGLIEDTIKTICNMPDRVLLQKF